MDIKEIKRVHFIGVGGIGISYIAHFFIRQGATVSGSDLSRSQVTDQLAQAGAAVFEGHDANNVPNDAQLVIANDAIPADNPERLKAKELGIKVMSNFEVVGLISKDYITVAIAGNKGKTTTSAMLATILEQAGCDPTGMVGSIVNDWKCNFRAGKSEILVVEADEYKEHFLQIKTNKAAITNMAADHLDYFGDEQGVIKAFQKFVDGISTGGVLVINNDDTLTKQLTMPKYAIITFGIDAEADLRATNLKTSQAVQTFKVTYKGDDLGEWSLPFPGKFNVYNSLAAIALAFDLGVEPKEVKKALANFKGTWRRFQILGRYKEAVIISDYAHHPVAVHATLEAVQDFYPEHKIVAVFQSHTRHRTKSLFDDFVTSLDPADLVIIPKIFVVSGRETVSEEEMNASILVEAIKKRDQEMGRERVVVVSGDLDETRKVVDENISPGDVVLFMGAGAIYKLAESL